ncbi:MAG: ABC transporter permease [Proteobacteria bacterium]|nr:ABC transporter permease [Pseudomonadota bacterium]
MRAAAAVALTLGVLALASLTPLFDAGLALDVGARLAPPSAGHWFGTDPLGRDVLALVAVGARTSLAVAIGAVLAGLALGTPLGLLAAARGGFTDELVARGNDLVFAFPALLLAVLLSAALGPGALTAVVAIGLFNVPVFARLTRASALSLMTRDFVRAARLAGRGPLSIAFVHLLPNLAGLLLVQGAIQLSLGIAAEAGLSYVGLGAQPPAPSWGRMLNEAQTLVGVAPWLAVFPGLALTLAVLALGVLGDGLAARLGRPSGGVR